MRIGIIYTLYLRAHIISSLYTMQLNSCTIEWFKHLVIGIPKCIEFIIINNGHTDSYFIYLYIYIYIYIYRDYPKYYLTTIAYFVVLRLCVSCVNISTQHHFSCNNLYTYLSYIYIYRIYSHTLLLNYAL